MNDAWEIVRLDVDEEIGVGSVVLLIGRIHYRGKGSGIEGESPSGYMLKFSQAKALLRFRPFREPEEGPGSCGAVGVGDVAGEHSRGFVRLSPPGVRSGLGARTVRH